MKILGTLASLAVLIAGLAVAWAWQLSTTPVVLPEPVVVTIPRGASPRSVAQELEKLGVVDNAELLLLLARFRGSDRSIRFGVHEFTGSLTPEQVLEELGQTPKPTIRITVPEGMTWAEIGTMLEAEGIVGAKKWKQAVCAPSFVSRAGATETANCAEGFLFPDTYHLGPGMTADEIASLMIGRFEQVWDQLLNEHQIPEILTASSNDALLSRNRVTTLASIVEKETGAAQERRRIAGVFANRLNRKMRLQTDPTVIYGILASGRAWDGNLRRTDLREATIYNTYVNHGLPPGPICSPGRKALAAALDPESV
ncbi:MAG: UPF0755 protein, partial [Hyphomicrobiaceae bacterium]